MPNPQPGEQLRRIRNSAKTKREELTHLQQGIYARSFERGKHIDPAYLPELTEGPTWAKLSAALDKRRYSKDDPESQIIEAAAKLIAGREAELGVTQAEASEWLKEYRAALEHTHGTRAAEEVFS